MKVALLTDGIFPYVIGGMQKHSYYLAKYLAKEGVRVDLYHTNQSKLEIDKLELFSDDEKKMINSFVIPFPKPGKLPGHYIKASFQYSESIYNVFKKQEPVDYVYAKGFSAWKLISEKKMGYKCAPIGVNFHGYEMFQKAPDFKSHLASKFLLQKPVNYNINNADHIFSYGGKITTLLQSLGIINTKIIEIPTGIEESWLQNNIRSANNIIKFCFVGRYERRKGIEELSAVIKELLPQHAFEFHFIGPIPSGNKIKHDYIKYHGAITDANAMKGIVSEMDVLVCPSHSEGMPNVILEAMASGLAIIATNVGAVSLMVSSLNGVLIEPNNKSALKNAIIQLIESDKEIVNNLKRSSLKLVKDNFLWKEVIKTTISKIAALI